MARGDMGFCTVHRIGYNRRLDPICPQCTMNRMQPAEQLEFDSEAQRPLDKASGAPLDPFTLQPVK